MFLMRAVFWIAMVAVFAPRPPVAENARASEASAIAIEQFRDRALAELARVKAEFAAQDREARIHARHA